MNFTAEYQIAFEEFNEASLAVTKHFQKRVLGHNTSFKRGMFGWILFIVAATVLFFLFHKPITSTIGATPPSIFSVIGPFWPWVVLFFAAWIFAFIRLRRTYRNRLHRVWNASPNLHQVRTVQIDDEGMTMSVATSGTRTIWPHYVRFEETPNLFLLYATEHVAEFIPKRIFTDLADENAFRDLLQRNITAATQAFPVIPVAKLAPSESVEEGETK